MGSFTDLPEKKISLDMADESLYDHDNKLYCRPLGDGPPENATRGMYRIQGKENQEIAKIRKQLDKVCFLWADLLSQPIPA